MKIAVACENNQVFQHFGHTPEFAVFTVENKNVVSREILSCGDTGHGALAGLLRQGGIDLLICGGIGGIGVFPRIFSDIFLRRIHASRRNVRTRDRDGGTENLH